MDESTGSRAARQLSRRGGALRLGPLAAVAFLVVLDALFNSTWQLMPFPDPQAVLVAFACGLAFGLAVHRWWALWLTLLVLPAALGGEGGIFGAIVALCVAGPFAFTGLTIGVAAARRLQRIALRRILTRGRVKKTGGLHAPPGLGA